jgi:hypothetical protein
MPLPTEDDYKLADKNLDDAIANLMEAARPGIDDKKEGGFSERVYGFVGKLVEAGNAVKAVYNYKITDIEERTTTSIRTDNRAGCCRTNVLVG